MSETKNPLRLGAIHPPPADNDEINNYARGVVLGTMRNATPNVVGSLLARIRAMDNQKRIDDAIMSEAAVKLDERRDEIRRLKERNYD